MLDAGLFHILVPRDLGGAGGSVVDWFDAAVAVAQADPAAGWIMAQGAVQNAWIAVAGSPGGHCIPTRGSFSAVATRRIAANGGICSCKPRGTSLDSHDGTALHTRH